MAVPLQVKRVGGAPGAWPSELEALERLCASADRHADVRVEVQVDGGMPVYSLAFGSRDPAHPAAGFFGGVHGLERIGTEVVLAFLANLLSRLAWDDSLHALLARCRVVFMPLVNPGGLARGTRANPAGIDLMRNAPVEALEPVPWLLGGQRRSARLPWYRGADGAAMEPEATALCAVVERELLVRPFALSVDCHSGFGLADRLWFPYAHTRVPAPQLATIHALMALYESAHPQHRYVFEPQSRQYLTHGDLWDHLVRCAGERSALLALTLEMGSWTWVRKNPRQLFSRHGIFNPLIEHRRSRVLRRHMTWLDFAMRAAASHRRWVPSGAERSAHERSALQRWYPERAAGTAEGDGAAPPVVR